MRKQSFRGLWWFAHSHLARKWQSYVLFLGGLICSEHSGLCDREMTLSSESQLQRFTLDIISIWCQGHMGSSAHPVPSFPVWVLLGVGVEGYPRNLRSHMEGVLGEVTWVGFQQTDSSLSCGQSVKLRLQPGLQWEGKRWEFKWFLCNPIPGIDLHKKILHKSSCPAEITIKSKISEFKLVKSFGVYKLS